MVNKIPTSLQVRMARAHGPLGRLIGHAGRQDELGRRVRRLLPAPLDSHCLGAEWTDNRLTLVLDSPAWAARARYLTADIRRRLAREINPPPRSLGFRTARQGAGTGEETKSRSRRRPAPGTRLDAGSRDHLLAVARSIRDSELREALERLAHSGRRDDSRN